MVYYNSDLMVGYYLLLDSSALHSQSEACWAPLWSGWASYQSMQFSRLGFTIMWNISKSNQVAWGEWIDTARYWSWVEIGNSLSLGQTKSLAKVSLGQSLTVKKGVLLPGLIAITGITWDLGGGEAFTNFT